MEEITIHTIIDPDLMRRTLIRGSVAAGLGIVIILITAIEMPLTQLGFWGIPILIVGLGLIALGLVPYKILSKRQTSPDALTITEENLLYAKEGKATLTIPYSSISRVWHYERAPLYGVLITMRHHPAEKIHVHDHNYDIRREHQRSQKRFHADLFFPFFDETRFNEIRRALALAGYTDEV